MAYEMLINAGVTGQAQVEGLGKATDDLSARTAKLNEVMYGEGTAIKQLAFGLEKLTATSIASAQANNQLSVRLVEVMERMTAAKMAGAGLAVANDQVAASSERASIGTRNMTATLRGLEGAMPLRAAASLLTTFSALGPIAQVAFQGVGVVAMGSVLVSIGEKLGIHLNYWKQIANAQKESNKELQTASEKYASNLKELRDLNDEEYKRTHGGAAAQGVLAVRSATAAKTTDSLAIAQLEQQLAALQKISSWGTGYVGGAATVPTFQQRMLGMSAPQGISPTDFKFLTDQEAAAAILSGVEITGGERPSNTQQRIAKMNIPTIEKKLSDARVQQEKDRAQSDILTNPKKDPDEVARENLSKAAEAQKKAEERVTHLEELSARTREMQIKALYTDSGPGYNLMFPPVNRMIPMDPHVLEGATRQRESELERIRTERAKELKTATPGEAAGINAEFGKQETATWTIYTKEASAALKEFTEKIAKAAEGADKIGEEYDKGREKQAKATEVAINQIAPLKLTPLTGQISIEQELRDARQGGSQRLALARAQGQAGGLTPQAEADQAYQIRIDMANKELDALVRKANKEDDVKAKQDAIDEAEQKYFDAQMEHQQALLEITLKQRHESEEMAGSLFDAIKGRTTNQWWRSLYTGQEKQIFENVASIPIQQARGVLGGLVPNTGMLGTLLHGTLLDNANSPADKTEKHTADTVTELKALRNDVRSLNGAPAAETGSAAVPDFMNLPTTGLGSSAVANILYGTGGLMGTGIGAGSAVGAGLVGAGSTLSQFMGGVSSGPSLALGRLLGISPQAGTVGYASGAESDSSGNLIPRGTQLDQWGNPIKTSAATKIGEGVSVAASAAAAGYGIYQGLKQGGTTGDLRAASSGLGAASLIPGPQAPFLAAASTITSVLASILAQTPQKRAGNISNELQSNAYLAPSALNVTQGMNGTYEDFGARGNLRTSTMSAMPMVAEPYITSRVYQGQRTYYDAPGYQTAPFSGAPTGTGQTPVSNVAGGTLVIVNGGIQAIDPQSFHELMQKPSSVAAVGESVATHLQSHEGRLSNQIRFVAGAS